MLARLAALSILIASACGAARAQPLITGATTEAAGDSGHACLAFNQPIDTSNPGRSAEFLTLEPATRPGIEITDGKLCLSGLAFGTHYTVTVKPGLPLAGGGATTAAAATALDIPPRDPMVAIAGRGWILPRQGATGVTIQSIDVPVIRIHVLRVSARRLTGGGVTPDPAKTSFSPWEIQNLTRGTATEIWSGTMQASPGAHRLVETGFPLAGIVDPARPGAYIVLAEDAAHPAARLVQDDDTAWNHADADAAIAGHWVLSTDLGLSTLKGQDGLHASVRSLGTAAPLAGVRLQLLSRGQDVLAEVTTGAAGEALFPPGLLRGKRGAAAAMLVASTPQGDLAAQDLTGPAFDLSDRGADGRVTPGPIEAYVYTDRGIYRPGETVQTMALLRTRGLTAVDDAALTLVLRRPDGVEASRATLPPQPAAGFHWAVPLSATAAQGAWTIEVLTDPTLPPVGRTTIMVQDFVPQQLKVTLTGPTGPVTTRLTASIDGRFLYGAPAAGLHGEGEIRLLRDEHPVPDAAGYRFGLVDETIGDPVSPLTLDDADDKGHLAIDVPLTIPGGLASPLRVELDAGLTEPTGRTVRETLSIPVRTHATLIGIHPRFNDRVNEGEDAGFDIRAFSAAGAPIARPGLTWELIREDRRWDWWRENGAGSAWTWHFHTVDVPVTKGAVDVPAERPASLTKALDWGDYRLIVTDAQSGAATSIRFAVGWGGGDAAADVPDRLEVSTDRPVLAPGQTARLHLRGPFAGPAEVTVESNGQVLQTLRADLPAEGLTLPLTASDAWGAGVHVLATAYRPLLAPSRPHDPVRAVGLTWIASDPAPRTLGVTLAGPSQITPRQNIKLPIHVTGASGAAFVTLAAVDEGILQLTRFVSPDPVGTLLGRTRLGLDMRDDYGRLLEGKAETGAPHEGGDGGALGGEGLAVTTTRTVALFHGPVALDAHGDAVIDLDIPDFAGALRLMAVAYDHEAAGHAVGTLTVRDPVVADLALPRFLAPGDVAGIGISLNNVDGAAGDYHLALRVTGAIALNGVSGLDMHLDAGQRQETRVSLTGQSVGIGHVQAVLTGPDHLRVEHAWDIAVRSPHPALVVSQTEAQAPNAVYSFDPALLKPFTPGSVQVTIGYSALGGLDVPGLLQSLYTYPYGCTEQVAAAAFPLLYFDDARLLGKPAGDPAVRARVQTAIATIVDRQDAEGRFGLWRVGDGAASVWLNVFALDFLLHAREAGLSVPDAATARAAAWIEQQLRSNEIDTSGAYAEPAQPTRAYAAYVLARTSRTDPAGLRALSRDLQWEEKGGVITPARVTWGGKALAPALALAQLAGAQSLMGDAAGSATSFRLALANLDGKKPPDWWSHAYYWSRLRDTAGILAIAAETGHADAAAPLLERISRDHPDPERMSTQEKAWLLAAAHALNKQGGTRALAVDAAAPDSVPLPFALSPAADALARGLTVRNADTRPIFRTVTLRGAPVVAPPAMSQGFTLRRETFALNGDRLDDKRLRQTDRFIVVLSGRASGSAFRRAVVLDPLPAGLEIEAAILKDDTYPFIGQLSALRAHEQRDDRFIAAFETGSKAWFREVNDDVKLPLEETEFRVAYVVRAVTPGHYVRPETVVEDMYSPQVTARTAAAAIDIAPR